MHTLWLILSWIVFGFFVGALARFIMPGKQSMSWLMTSVLGIVGSFAGGAIYQFARYGTFVGPDGAGWIVSILGALLVLFIYGQVMKNKA